LAGKTIGSPFSTAIVVVTRKKMRRRKMMSDRDAAGIVGSSFVLLIAIAIPRPVTSYY
jgi:hypothetical protein